MFRKTLIAATFALGTVAALPAAAQISGSIVLDVAPPAARVEVVPAPRRGYIWAPGYWRWEEPRRTHVWVEGSWVEERPGYRWTADTWVPRERRYYYAPGRWERVN